MHFDDDEKLLENTTYTINFGAAIKDLNEGNVLENFKYVFSTGEIIDSLSIQGQVLDAGTNKPVEGVLVMLYDRLEDSVVYQDKPIYFSKTNKEGNYRIENIREDSFYLRALKDENLTYLYDLDSELIGYYEDGIFLTGDTIQPTFDLRLLKKPTPLKILETIQKRYGEVKVVLNQPSDDLQITPIDSFAYFDSKIREDTLYVWYEDAESKGKQFEIHTGNRIDTLVVADLDISNLDGSSLRYISANTTGPNQRKPKESLKLTFDMPLTSVDTSKIILTQNDTVPIRNFTGKIDANDQTVLTIQTTWVEAASYKLNGLPGTVANRFGMQNDTIGLRFRNAETKDFGNVFINITGLDSTQNYALILLNKNRVLQRRAIKNSRIAKFTFPLLPPGTYTAKLIEDRNGNLEWDTGDYIIRKTPERVLIKDMEALRAGWDVTLDIAWKNK